MHSPGIYFVSYFRHDGDVVYATVQAENSFKAIDSIVLQEQHEGFDVLKGSAELMCPDRLLTERKS
jgi:hypothetical protein